MPWNSPAVLEIRNDPDQIEIKVEKDSRTQQRVIGAAVSCLLAFVLIQAWRGGHHGMQLYIGLLFIVCVYSLIASTQVEKGELRVRATNLSYRYSCAGGIRTGEFAASDVKEIDFGHGSKHSPCGLYVRHGLLGHTCILPNVTEDEAYRLRGIIMDRFVEFNNGLAAPNSLITLGLNR